MFLHLYLIVILGDFILAEVRQARVLDEHSNSPILLNDIALNECLGLTGCEDTASLILLHFIASDNALRLH